MNTRPGLESSNQRGWIVIGVTFVTLGLVYGIWNSYSVFLVAFLREFGWSRSLVAGAFSVFVLIHGCMSPIAGWVGDRVGARRLIMPGGCALGCGLLLLSLTSEWWHLYLSFGMVPFTQFLFDRIGWRWTFRVLAALVVGFILGNLGTQMLLVHQVAYLVDHGASLAVVAAVAGFVGLVSIPGKMGWGILSDRTNRELAYTLAFACFSASLGVLVLAGRYPESGLAYLYAVLVSLGYSATAPLTPASASDLFGGPRFSTIFGTLHIGNSLGAAAGAWIAGQIFDRTQSYAGALWVAFASAVLAPTLLRIVAPRRPHPPPISRH